MKTGKTVRFLEDLFELARAKRSVVVSRGMSDNVHPASFVLNWNASLVHNLLKSNSIKEYVKSKTFWADRMGGKP